MDNKRIIPVKLLFLDFDGVITTDKSKWEIDNEKCAIIKDICDCTGAKIVITSAWRGYSLDETIKKNCLQNWILRKYCIGVTERCFLPDDKWFIPKRGLEIEKYINDYIENNHIQDDIEYVIIDDDVFDLLYNQRNHIVRTHWKNGISIKNAKKAIKILNNKNNI